MHRITRMEGPIFTSIKQKLTTGLKPQVLNIVDDSPSHSGHAGVKDAVSKETHFKIFVVSNEFLNKNLVQRHRLVYTLLDKEFKDGLHALSMDLKTETEANK